jgi:C-terminal processing protease CtpA/Prc
LRRAAFEQLGSARDIAQTYPIILATLRSLGDRHSFLIPPGSLGTSYPTGRQPREAPPRPAVLASDIGFVFVPGFMGGTRAEEQAFAQAVQQDIAEQDGPDACGWIVDLRRDVGGNMWPMLVGLGPLLPSGPLGYFRDARGRLEAWSYRDGRAFQAGRVTASLHGRAYVMRRPLMPLAILIGPSTASSGEAVAIALHAAPRSRSFGMPSAGFTTGNATFALSDGAMLLLETTRFVDKAKSVLDGPLQPDQTIASSGGDADETLVEAQAWLHSACRLRH